VEDRGPQAAEKDSSEDQEIIFSLDERRRWIYSVPIFDTLAPSAIPVAVTKRIRSVASLIYPTASISYSPVSNRQRLTMFSLTEVSTLIAKKSGNHPRY
jgi:hypothetical protein